MYIVRPLSSISLHLSDEEGFADDILFAALSAYARIGAIRVRSVSDTAASTAEAAVGGADTIEASRMANGYLGTSALSRSTPRHSIRLTQWSIAARSTIVPADRRRWK